MLFDNTNPYTVFEVQEGGITKYFVSFNDGQAVQEIEVSCDVYKEFQSFLQIERNLRRSDERNTEQSDLTELTLHKRAIDLPLPMEDAVMKKLTVEKLKISIARLPEIQRRRIYQYFFENKTYDEIAKAEHCTKRAIKFSVDAAIKNLKKSLS